MTTLSIGDPALAGHWLSDAGHRAFLLADARRQLAFFDTSLRSDGGFDVLALDGTPLPYETQELHTTTRLVHSYALGRAIGHAGSDAMIDAGMGFLWNAHRDTRHGGYLWAVGPSGTVTTKLAYGHVFVLLAAASAKRAGHPDADRLLADVSEVLLARFWDDEAGLLRDEFEQDWTPFSTYRGMNANMHGVEAMLAAYEVTQDAAWLDRSRRILDFFTAKMAGAYGGRIPEHYDDAWQVDPPYAGDPMFRPAGTTPGHSFEMARLLLQHWDVSGRPEGDAPARARRLVERAYKDAWLSDGGFAYTLRLDGAIDRADRYWWPVTEAIGALASLIKLEGQEADEVLYRRIWRFADLALIDHTRGGWYPEIDSAGRPSGAQFGGKPDIYHALQADLFPLADGLSRQHDALYALAP